MILPLGNVFFHRHAAHIVCVFTRPQWKMRDLVGIVSNQIKVKFSRATSKHNRTDLLSSMYAFFGCYARGMAHAGFSLSNQIQGYFFTEDLKIVYIFSRFF